MKTPEEIRKDNQLSQKSFTEKIGMSMRTYQARLFGNDDRQRSWKLCEVAEIAKLNKGEVEITELDTGKKYQVKIKEIID